MNLYFFIFEFGAICGLLAIFYHERKDRKLLQILALSFIYGMILEALNIHMSNEIYTYSSVFLLQIMGVPLAIGSGWAVLFYLSYGAADRFNLAWWQSPFLMALIALSYDLTMDAVAIRLGFWQWKIPLDQEWFGVPYDNFFGWLAVVWTFAFFLNLSFQDFVKEKYRKVIFYTAPVTSALLLGAEIMVYVNLSAVLSGRFSWGEAMRYYNSGQYFYAYVPEVQAAKGFLLSAIILFLSVALLFWNKKSESSAGSGDVFSLHLSLSIHAMFFVLLFASGIYKDYPIFVVISVLMLILTLLLENYPKALVHKNKSRPLTGQRADL